MSQAPKKAANLSINRDLLDKAKALNINLSATLEESLRHKIRAAEGERWRQENKSAIEAYNDFVAEHGLFSDSFRKF